MDFKVKALRVEKTLTYNDRDNEHEENHKDILLLESKDKWGNVKKFELSLWTIYGDCYSGWCAASYGYNEFKCVKEFNGYNYVPIKDLTFSLDIEENNISEIPEMQNEIFTYTFNDGDHYYANGNSSVNLELFKPTPRLKEKRPVWIFTGDSNIGKSYLAHLISNNEDKEVYETDEDSNLPNKIVADIVVIGNKYKYSAGDVKSKLEGNNNDVIIVDFKCR